MASDNVNEAFEVLKEYMINNHNAKTASGGREIVKRCHFCGDSRDLNDAHMYIGVRNNGDICYNCFKCNAGGVVDGTFLRGLGCYEQGLIDLCQSQISNTNAPNYMKSNAIKWGLFDKRHYIYPIYENDKIIDKKLNYISKRLGCRFNQRDASMFRIVLNIEDFLDANGITRFTRHPNIMDILNKFFIGFLSADGNYITMRRLIPEGKLPEFIDHRYVNYNIFGKNNGVKFYTIPMSINPCYTVDIHIAEGVFDILSIYSYVAPLGCNGIFVAVNGKSYDSILKSIISNIGIMNFNLHIYLDLDVDDSSIRKIVNKLQIFGCRIFVHRNKFGDEKDYGVPMSNILDSSIEI